MKGRAAPRTATGGLRRESTVDGPPRERQTEQYSPAKILGVCAAAALPMRALAWVVTPLVFRGLLLPRMKGAFGRFDWVANGVLFAPYHLHMPWAIPANLLDIFALAYPSRRYQSALIGIVVHSSQGVFVLALVLYLVLR